MLGTFASHGVGLVAKRVFDGEHENTQEAAMMAAKLGAFWLIAGFSWIAMCKRNGVNKS